MSIEEKLYTAFHNCSGVRLTADDVEQLLMLDDAIQTRICNRAAQAVNADEPGQAAACFGTASWKELCEFYS